MKLSPYVLQITIISACLLSHHRATGSAEPEYGRAEQAGQTTRIFTTGEVDDNFWLKHLGEDFKRAIHLDVDENGQFSRISQGSAIDHTVSESHVELDKEEAVASNKQDIASQPALKKEENKKMHNATETVNKSSGNATLTKQVESQKATNNEINGENGNKKSKEHFQVTTFNQRKPENRVNFDEEVVHQFGGDDINSELMIPTGLEVPNGNNFQLSNGNQYPGSFSSPFQQQPHIVSSSNGNQYPGSFSSHFQQQPHIVSSICPVCSKLSHYKQYNPRYPTSTNWGNNMLHYPNLQLL